MSKELQFPLILENRFLSKHKLFELIHDAIHTDKEIIELIESDRFFIIYPAALKKNIFNNDPYMLDTITPYNRAGIFKGLISYSSSTYDCIEEDINYGVKVKPVCEYLYGYEDIFECIYDRSCVVKPRFMYDPTKPDHIKLLNMVVCASDVPVKLIEEEK